MDANTIAASSGTTAGIILVCGIIYKFLIHSRCKSTCCGRSAEIQTDLTPPRNEKPDVIV